MATVKKVYQAEIYNTSQPGNLFSFTFDTLIELKEWVSKWASESGTSGFYRIKFYIVTYNWDPSSKVMTKAGAEFNPYE